MEDAFRQVWNLDEPIVIRVRHELDPANARFLAAIGAGYVVDPSAPRCERRCGRKECSVSVIATRRWCRINGCGFEPDEGSEFCRTHRFSANDANGRDLLDRMDAGEPVTPTRAIDVPFVSPGDEPDEIEEREPQADEVAGEVAGAHDSASAQASQEPEPSRSSSTPEPEEEPEMVETAPANGRAHKWTPEIVIAAIQRWARENGRPPTQRDWLRRGDYHPAFSSAAKTFGGSWGAALKAAGFENPRKGSRRGTTGAPTVRATDAAHPKADGKQPSRLDHPFIATADALDSEALLAEAEISRLEQRVQLCRRTAADLRSLGEQAAA